MLTMAIAGDAGVLVTGDKFLQTLSHDQNVLIRPPRQFLTVLANEQA